MKKSEVVKEFNKYPGEKDVLLRVNGKVITDYTFEIGKEDITIVGEFEEVKTNKKSKIKVEDETETK